MQSVLIEDTDWRDGFGKKLFDLQQSGQFCDVIIKTAEDARLLVHSCVLAAASPLLKGVIESALNDASLGTIMLSSDIDVNTWTHMLEFMYTGCATVPDSLVSSLQSGANILKIDTLIDRCNEVLTSLVVTKTEVEAVPVEATELYSAIAQIKEDQDAVIAPQAIVEDQTESTEAQIGEEPESAIETPSVLEKDESAAAVTTEQQDPIESQITVIQESVMETENATEEDQLEPISDELATPNVQDPSIDAQDGIEAQDGMETQDYIDDVQDAPGALDYISADTTAISSIPSSTDVFDAFIANGNPAVNTGSVGEQQDMKILTELFERDRVQLENLGGHYVLIGTNENGEKQYLCTLCGHLCSDPSAHDLAHKEKTFVCNVDGCDKSYKNKFSWQQHISTHSQSEVYVNILVNQCPKCGKSFKTSYLLKKHMAITCNDAKPYKCKFCGKCFKAFAKLQYHEGIHAVVKPYKCITCGKAVATKAHLRNHAQIHDEKKYSCFCGKEFYAARRYKEHYKNTHDPSHPFRCHICQKNMKSAKILEKHKLSHSRPYSCQICKKGFLLQVSCMLHETQKHQIPHPEIQDVSGNDATCPICLKVFKNKKSMQMHTGVHTKGEGHACKICGKIMKLKKHLHSHMKTHLEKNIPCPKCNKTFKHEKYLHIHLKSHEKPFSCDVCGARFAFQRYLQTHIEGHEKGKVGKVYSCPYCDKIFPSRSNIQIHLEENHSDQPKVNIFPNPTSLQLQIEKPDLDDTGKYTCNLCDEKLSNEEALRAHHLEHQRPYSCSVCKQTFEQGLQRINHEKETHGIEIDPPIDEDITCPVCLKTYKSHNSMQSHLSLHGQIGKYTCQVCGKVFNLVKNLKSHLSVHMDKVFSCEICLKKFKTNKSLKMHQKVHYKPFACDICESRFSDSSTLKSHVVKHKSNAKPDMYKCAKCNELFSDTNSLKLHVKENHRTSTEMSEMIIDKEKFVFDCEICMEVFPNEESLTNHEIKKHENNKKVKCKVCKVQFISQRTLSCHLFSAHSEGEELPCNNCERTFFVKTSLQNHRSLIHGISVEDETDKNDQNISKVVVVKSSNRKSSFKGLLSQFHS